MITHTRQGVWDHCYKGKVKLKDQFFLIIYVAEKEGKKRSLGLCFGTGIEKKNTRKVKNISYGRDIRILIVTAYVFASCSAFCS